jgi:hypothetical protein
VPAAAGADLHLTPQEFQADLLTHTATAAALSLPSTEPQQNPHIAPPNLQQQRYNLLQQHADISTSSVEAQQHSFPHLHKLLRQLLRRITLDGNCSVPRLCRYHHLHKEQLLARAVLRVKVIPAAAATRAPEQAAAVLAATWGSRCKVLWLYHGR